MSHTPTTDEIRHEYAVSYVAEYQQEGRAEFDRWLAAHDAALIEKLADEWSADPDAWGDNEKDYRNTLREKARQRRGHACAEDDGQGEYCKACGIEREAGLK